MAVALLGVVGRLNVQPLSWPSLATRCGGVVGVVLVVIFEISGLVVVVVVGAVVVVLVG